MKKFLRVISELFYPSGIKCVICGDDLPVKTRYCICNKCELAHNTKYCLHCGRAMKNMADYMADAYIENGLSADLITFVPMPIKRQKTRGYNQGFVIAQKLSEILNIPCIETLRRIKETANLARMNRKERAEAISDSFGILSDCSVKDKNILLVDDVFTTGATTNECSRVLKKYK